MTEQTDAADLGDHSGPGVEEVLRVDFFKPEDSCFGGCEPIKYK